MRIPGTIGMLCCLVLIVSCQRADTTPVKKPQKSETGFIDVSVEASCGQCQFEMEGDGCDLAVRINGSSYFVDGSHIDDHGDAHGDQGLCNCIRQAKVSGEVKDGRFQATSFKLLPLSAGSDPKLKE